ncbi:MAG: hypothetical protein PGN09_09360 [Sphingomonas fennica]
MRVFSTVLLGATVLAALTAFNDRHATPAQAAGIGAVLVGSGYVSWGEIEQKGRGWSVKRARFDEDNRLYDLTLTPHGYGVVTRTPVEG